MFYELGALVTYNILRLLLCIEGRIAIQTNINNIIGVVT